MELQELRQKCLEQARRGAASAVDEDDFIIQAITNIGELDSTLSSLSARIREWYSLYFPELARNVRDNETFVRKVLEADREELMKEIGIENTAGAGLEEKDLLPVMEYAESAQGLFRLRQQLTDYLEETMDAYCRNLKAVAGATIGAKLLAEAGSLKRMAKVPSTVIQTLGAEKALFRHLRTGAKPPRHGHIFAHPLIQGAKEKDRGRVARGLANKIAIAARADYFGKDFIGEDLREELEEKFNGS